MPQANKKPENSKSLAQEQKKTNLYTAIAARANYSFGRDESTNAAYEYAVVSKPLLKLAQNELSDGINPYDNSESFLKIAALASSQIPLELRSHLWDFKMHGNKAGYYHIKSLPYDLNLMDTPNDPQKILIQKKTFLSEFWLGLFASILGEPFSYIQENNGNLFHNVRPTKANEDKLSSESSKVLLDLHTETAFHPLLPDFLLLFCLRGDRTQEAKTIISSLGDIKELIDPDLDAILRKPLFRTGIDFSFGSDNGHKGNGPVLPIFQGDKQNTLMIFDPDLMVGINEAANQAIIRLKKLLDLKKKAILLQPGDLLLVDNLRATHGRNNFKAFFDGQDRWLQRLYVTRNLQLGNKIFGKKERIITHTMNTLNNEKSSSTVSPAQPVKRYVARQALPRFFRIPNTTQSVVKRSISTLARLIR
jgi:hypothetical protein